MTTLRDCGAETDESAVDAGLEYWRWHNPAVCYAAKMIDHGVSQDAALKWAVGILCEQVRRLTSDSLTRLQEQTKSILDLHIQGYDPKSIALELSLMRSAVDDVLAQITAQEE